MGHYRHVPRSFAGAQDDSGSGKGQRPLAADSGKRTADRSRLLAPSSRLPAFGCPLSHCPTVPLSHCLAVGFRLPAPGGRLPADWYLQADGSLSACTEILRCAQDDCGRREGGCLKSDVWCLNVSVLSGIPLSGQRIAVSGQLSCYPAGDPVTLSLYSWPKAIPPPSARRAAAPFYTTRRRQAATTLGAKGLVHLPL